MLKPGSRSYPPALGQTAEPSISTADRIVGLDGVRGLAALYVVVHHCWLLSFPGYPDNTGPAWVGWLLYGRLAVVLFITLSGFSLAVGPARDAWRLGGGLRYAGRRARRILPAYWAALAISMVIASVAAPLALSHPPTGWSVVVYGLLLQDFVTAPAPNGAFWSIAVEAALYLAFPLLLLIRRRAGATATLALVWLPVIAAGLWWPSTATSDKATGYAWELAPLFTIGLVAAGVVAGDRRRALPWHWLAALAAAPVVLVIVANGPAWTVRHFFWIDLAIGPAIAAFLAALATGRPGGLTRLLAARPLSRLGQSSYSLYLIHMPIVALIYRYLVMPHLPAGLPTFWVTLLLAIPASLVAATMFAKVFEAPFRAR